ncbi:MAG: S8 family serine peptidase [Oligoflexia bacterium]|nr:S8 family serine peptidase [Oligoflexia bacterium]
MKLNTLFIVAFFLFSNSAQAGLIKLKNQVIDTKNQINVFGLDQGFSQAVIIQFAGPVQRGWKEELSKNQVELYGYVPENSFIAKINEPMALENIKKFEFVEAVIPYSAQFKIDQQISVPSVFNKNITTKFSITLTSSSYMSAMLNELEKRGVELAGFISDRNIILISNTQTVYELAEIDYVEWVEPYAELKYLDDLNPFDGWIGKSSNRNNFTSMTGYESGTKLMNFEEAHKLGYNGQGVIVGVTDTGLDTGSVEDIHTDFKGQVIKGYIRGLFSKSWGDPQGHGTHVAGSVVGTGAASEGRVRGGAYGAKLVMQSNWTPMVNNALAAPSLEKLFEEPFKNDSAVIHTNSWGQNSNGTRYNAMTASLDEVLWKNPDLLVLFAAGNSGADLNSDGVIDNGSLGTPAGAKNILSVGASKNYVFKGGIQTKVGKLKGAQQKWSVGPMAETTLSDNPMGMAPFSSTGPTQDGRIKPDIVAPGTNILSARSHHPKATLLWGEYDGNYVWAGGTSMSTPLTAGAAAVVYQYLKTKANKAPSAAAVKAALIHNAFDLFPGQFGEGAYQEFKTKRPNPVEGFGRVDVGAVIKTPYYFIDDKIGLKTGDKREITLGLEKVVAGSKMRATLVYTDAPGAAAALSALVNDIDISLVAPNGAVYYPNHNTSPDRVNNVEMIEFEAPLSGAYKLLITAYNVPKGSREKDAQPYALVWNYHQ